jgi:hypothetical protein
MRVSSINTAKLVDQFHHVLRQIAPELHHLAGHGVPEAQFRRVQRLPRETESLENGAQGFRGAAIGRVSQ